MSAICIIPSNPSSLNWFGLSDGLVAKTKVDFEFFENINDYEKTIEKDNHYDYNGLDVDKL